MTIVDAGRLGVDLVGDASSSSAAPARAGLLVTTAASTSSGSAAGASARALAGIASVLTWVARRRWRWLFAVVDFALNLELDRFISDRTDPVRRASLGPSWRGRDVDYDSTHT